MLSCFAYDFILISNFTLRHSNAILLFKAQRKMHFFPDNLSKHLGLRDFWHSVASSPYKSLRMFPFLSYSSRSTSFPDTPNHVWLRHVGVLGFCYIFIYIKCSNSLEGKKSELQAKSVEKPLWFCAILIYLLVPFS